MSLPDTDSVNPPIRFKPWRKSYAPKKILAMRFQALGDTVITLPYLQSLKRRYPAIQLHFFTREEVSPIPQNIELFDKIITIGGGRNAKIQFLLMLLKIPLLLLERYDVILDLQNHKISNIVIKLLRPEAWTIFDKCSPHSAGERTFRTIAALNLWTIGLDTHFKIKTDALKLLMQHGWNADKSIVVLNPAGYSPSRNWPLDFYISFSKLWLEKINKHTQFVLLLVPSLREKANSIAHALGKDCIDLTGKSNQVEAFSVIQQASFMLSEDSGLMHMAWVQGIPTLALFSSSKKVWSAPQGPLSLCLDSSDLECGPCQQFECKYGDNRCLVRYTPEFVIDQARLLMDKKKSYAI